MPNCPQKQPQIRRTSMGKMGIQMEGTSSCGRRLCVHSVRRHAGKFHFSLKVVMGSECKRSINEKTKRNKDDNTNQQTYRRSRRADFTRLARLHHSLLCPNRHLAGELGVAHRSGQLDCRLRLLGNRRAHIRPARPGRWLAGTPRYQLCRDGFEWKLHGRPPKSVGKLTHSSARGQQ